MYCNEAERSGAEWNAERSRMECGAEPNGMRSGAEWNAERSRMECGAEPNGMRSGSE
jgi:hypothetical protein